MPKKKTSFSLSEDALQKLAELAAAQKPIPRSKNNMMEALIQEAHTKLNRNPTL